jgi:hypothetical protein
MSTGGGGLGPAPTTFGGAMPQGARMGDPVMQPGVPNANYANSGMPSLGAMSSTQTAQPSVYQPQYQQYQPQQRSAQPQQQTPNYQSGLQAAMMQMMQQYSRPAMRAPLQQGISPSSPMAYRPNMPTDNLRRVAPGVTYEQMHPTPPSDPAPTPISEGPGG